MGQKKLIRFAEINTFKNVLQYPEHTAGKWHEFFQNQHPIVLELACGKGEYSVGLAQLYPEKNFIGVDVKGNRIWVGAKKALQTGLNNVAFIRSQIGMIEKYFSPGEISEIWLPFPDPQLRTGKLKKRLTHPIFLRKYKQILKPGGYINLKTDSPVLYGFTKLIIEMYGLELVEDSADVNKEMRENVELQIRTHYESLDIAKSNRIHYLRFSMPEELDLATDEKLAKKVKDIESEISGETDNEEETN
ncbi:MAG: tRNA (guanosine(46)-N7)-methyltransferase TrmB [bacterium]|jgi:tRNA (guanine-N7-)-methyltransferase